jgi:hypothetical protein
LPLAAGLAEAVGLAVAFGNDPVPVDPDDTLPPAATEAEGLGVAAGVAKAEGFVEHEPLNTIGTF